MLAKYITGIIGGGAMGYFISNQFIEGNPALAVLGIGILFLYINLLFNIAPTKVIVKPTEYIAKKDLTTENYRPPKLRYKKKSGVIEKATIEKSQIGRTYGRPYIKLIIKTKPFAFHGRKIDKVYKAIGLVPQAQWMYDHLLKITGLPPKTSPEEAVTQLQNTPICFGLQEEEFDGVMRTRVTDLYKAPRNK